MVFIVRLQTSKGAKRIRFKDANATWKDLQLQVLDLYGFQTGDQRFTRDKQPIEANSTATLASLGLKHGDVLHLKCQEEAGGNSASGTSARPASAKTARTFKLTSRCRHGPRGRCLECVPDDDAHGDIYDGKPKDLNQGTVTALCTHGVGVTCLHCSQHVGDTKAEPALWLCNHPESVFCPNCIPPEEEDEEMKQKEEGTKVDKIPYRQFMKNKRALCQYKHPAHVSCVNCSDPEPLAYAGKTNCTRGHKPWPYGVCLACSPANAIVRVQPYRHCDTASLPSNLVQDFYARWIRGDPFSQRAAIMFGTYIDEPDATIEGGVRAKVQAFYEPPQESKSATKGFRFLKDPNEVIVHEVASWLGLAPVGWIITTRPREGGDKYKGKIFLSSSEVKQAAKFQRRYKDAKGHSRFCTVVVEDAKMVEPAAYQVSDQSVAMERDGLFGKAEDAFMMTVRKPGKGEMMSKVIINNKTVKAGQEFLPDEFIVKMIVAIPKVEDNMFKHAGFPSKGSDAGVKVHFQQFAGENYDNKVSDFNLLCFLATKNKALIKKVCEAFRKQAPLDHQTKIELDTMTIPFTYG